MEDVEKAPVEASFDPHETVYIKVTIWMLLPFFAVLHLNK
jgi:hypothetical protein